MEAVFTFKNTHDAIRGERILLDGGIRVKVMALPSGLGAGCGLCLRVAPDLLPVSRDILHEYDIVPEGIYFKRMENGKTVYSTLEASGLC
jgi:hypothetical protein